jgi:hypothetical protein
MIGFHLEAHRLDQEVNRGWRILVSQHWKDVWFGVHASTVRREQRRRLGEKLPEVRQAAIEQAFAKLKAFLRAARPGSFGQVCELIAHALQLFAPSECANYVRHSGYRVLTAL